MIKQACFLSGFLFLGLGAYAFSNNDTIKAQLVKEWKRSKAYTNEYLNAMPADKYGFRAVDSIRSFAELMLHLASANNSLGFLGTGAPPLGFDRGFGPTLDKRPGAQSKDSVYYYVNASYDYVINSLEQMDPAKLDEHAKTRNGLDESRLTFLSKALEHQTHERGQCTIYIRLQGIRPPAEKLF